ncbi:MAG: VOC family protein [Spirochaetaceae bacterium]|nr:VOC family protein [Spirochaetaceae bacterium]
MRRIVPHLWYDKEAGEAAEFYASILPDSAVLSRTKLGGTPSGEVELVSARLAGQEFQLISAGPYFSFTPAVSFVVAAESAAEAERLAAALGAGGAELMPFGAYPFAPAFAWVRDRYGLSWQVIFRPGPAPRRRIAPALLFTGAVCGRAEEAARFYASLFDGAGVGDILRYGPDEAPDREGTVKQLAFSLEGMDFTAMDSAYDHGFSFNEAVSFIVYVETQAELDRFWAALSAVPEAEQCGWLKDRFGLSWQVVPTAMDELMGSGDEASRARVTAAFLSMKKFDIAALKAAAEGGER